MKNILKILLLLILIVSLFSCTYNYYYSESQPIEEYHTVKFNVYDKNQNKYIESSLPVEEVTSFGSISKPQTPSLVTDIDTYIFSGLVERTSSPNDTLTEREVIENSTTTIIPARTLADKCYENMFTDCNSLTTITCLATDISTNDCLLSWIDGIRTNGIFKCSSSVFFERGINGISTKWRVENIG